ncbi:L,D-transpeptidase [Lentilitoribacter sp. Alg239-R112]|uniref:L,D-transpeptidase n=1 Tax=Lentilitoribacter sp. Alg239-R112 TaxID=2305987 RepID=UPI0013A6F882|nr:L,D-transpeptidase [Lentilitoribacter sp. Alg239-R112]
MLSRRQIIAGSLATLAALPTTHALAKKKFVLPRKFKPRRVNYRNDLKPGTIVVDPANHFLYFIENNRKARRYGVGVGRAGLAFKGSAIIKRKAEWPRWTPTQNMIRREPKKYTKYAGGLAGGINNPLGARALYLYKNGRDTHFRIHGTNQPSSIGQSVSSGCIRMINAHVEDLYNRVPLGARVIVI